MRKSRCQRFVAGITFLAYGWGLISPAWASQVLVMEQVLPPAFKIPETKGRTSRFLLQKQAPHTAHKLSLTVDQSQEGSRSFILDYEGWGGENIAPKVTRHLSGFDLSSTVIDQAMKLQFDRVLKPLHGVIAGLGRFELRPDGSFKLTRAYRRDLSPVTLDLTTAGKVFLDGWGFSDIALKAQEVTFEDGFEAGHVKLAAVNPGASGPLLTISQNEKVTLRDLTVLSGRVDNKGDLETGSLTLGDQAVFRNQKAASLESSTTLRLRGTGKLLNHLRVVFPAACGVKYSRERVYR